MNYIFRRSYSIPSNPVSIISKVDSDRPTHFDVPAKNSIDLSFENLSRVHILASLVMLFNAANKWQTSLTIKAKDKLLLAFWNIISSSLKATLIRPNALVMHILMADLTLPQEDGILGSISDTPPDHYTMKIQLFSQLAKNKIDAYHSSDFEAGGYKWKLVVHPNGNKDKGITDHISVYLVMTQVESLNLGWEIRATFRLFLLDQNKDKYFTLEDIAGKRFHRMKLEWGFDKFVPLTLFNDLEKGYLVNDTCVFGAEVYVTQEKHTGKGETLSMIKDAISYKHTWKIDNFSTLIDECLDSEPFNAANQTWKIQVYPKGKGSGTNNFVSVYLALAEPQKLSPATKIYAEFTIRILDQVKGKHYFGTANYWFSAKNSVRGWPRFVSVGYFNMQLAGLLVKNSCFVEAEVTVHGMADEF